MARSDQAIRVRLTRLEREAQHHPRLHALRLLALAAFGYLYPPADFLRRISEFFASETPPDLIRRWRAREFLSKTPITADHPCLIDRLAALECHGMLQAPCEQEICEGVAARVDPAESALLLLGDSLPRATAYVNATWKAQAIGRWRMQYAIAKEWAEKLEQVSEQASGDNAAERLWERMRIDCERAMPQAAVSLLRDFLAQHPDHAAANFELAQLLLARDDEQEAVDHFERAMRHGSEFIRPALHLLLNHYRECGRDTDADPIRARLEEHERAMDRARKERLKVTRKDRFLPHGLSADQVEKIRRILHRAPQVRLAYLARKEVQLFSDQPGYVLGISRSAGLLEDNRSADQRLSAYIISQIELPCAVIILSKSSGKLRRRLLEACPSPVFQTTD